MSEPKPDEHVMAHKQPSAGRVTVHGIRQYRRREDDFRPMTDCGISSDNHFGWLWLEYRTLNPDAVRLCRKCWRVEEVTP